MTGRRVDAILFDKDGTLFDFAGTWNAFGAQLIAQLAATAAVSPEVLAGAVHYDLAARAFLPDSPVIAGTNREVAERLAEVLPRHDPGAIEEVILREAAEAALQEAVPLVPFLAGLLARDFCLGVMTNDSESVARTHLRAAGVEGTFDFIAGADSGFGAKPSPAPLLAFARAVSVPPGRIAMVGDSLHDLSAGRAAGMQTVGVLTGVADARVLAPMADVVLPHIGHLPAWIEPRD